MAESRVDTQVAQQASRPCDLKDYNEYLEGVRAAEYPMLKDALYLDHAGTTPCPKSLIDDFASAMTAQLLGNPHSVSPSSQASTKIIEDVRHEALRYFHADASEFDLVFVQNATAGMKLVAECLGSQRGGFWFGYHKSAHTSLVGLRELAARGSRCFASDQEVEDWLQLEEMHQGKSGAHDGDKQVRLLGYPAQSNMNGCRLPLDWCARLYGLGQQREAFSLLDAAALVSTSPLDLSDTSQAADFTVLSFNKIFGFPDLGAVIVRRAAGHLLRGRRYFGGGTVDLAVALGEQWHMSKDRSIHEALEDGTPPLHNILALGCAIKVQHRLFKSPQLRADHVSSLSSRLHLKMQGLKHGNGRAVCVIYKDPTSSYGDPRTQGPIVAFSLKSSDGAWVSNHEVEKMAAVRNVHLRSGGLCNPGGVASALDLAPWELRENYSAGHRCGSERDVVNEKPTGVLRVSLGCMSTESDVDRLLAFIEEFFVDRQVPDSQPKRVVDSDRGRAGGFYVESILVYPIKSCGGWCVPSECKWNVRAEGLEWDREWCLVHSGSEQVLSQKRHPKMALIRPSIDLAAGVLRVRGPERPGWPPGLPFEITVPLSAEAPACGQPPLRTKSQAALVCSDDVEMKLYAVDLYSKFFSEILGVPCQLARFPAGGSGASTRSAKGRSWLLQQRQQQQREERREGAKSLATSIARPILLPNESPILTISRSSLNRLNEQIKARGGKAAKASVFRANIVVAQHAGATAGSERPFAEDEWKVIRIGEQYFEMLGPCRRCQMVCVDQTTAEKNEEPFVTLAKTRRVQGKVWFGQHTSHLATGARRPTITVGDTVRVLDDDECASLGTQAAGATTAAGRRAG